MQFRKKSVRLICEAHGNEEKIKRSLFTLGTAINTEWRFKHIEYFDDELDTPLLLWGINKFYERENAQNTAWKYLQRLVDKLTAE